MTGFRRPLEPGYTIAPFAGHETVRPDDVLELWASEGAVPEAEAEQRIHELLLVGTHEGGELAGVSSAFLRRNDRLQMDLWHFRVFVAAPHRKSALASNLAEQARDEMERRFVSGEDTRAGGMIYEVESPALKRLTWAIWRQTDFAFIGLNERGDHVRVRYFPGALAPDPPR